MNAIMCIDCGRDSSRQHGNVALGKSMYDGKWRCPICNRKYLKKYDALEEIEEK